MFPSLAVICAHICFVLHSFSVKCASLGFDSRRRNLSEERLQFLQMIIVRSSQIRAFCKMMGSCWIKARISPLRGSTDVYVITDLLCVCASVCGGFMSLTTLTSPFKSSTATCDQIEGIVNLPWSFQSEEIPRRWNRSKVKQWTVQDHWRFGSVEY